MYRKKRNLRMTKITIQIGDEAIIFPLDERENLVATSSERKMLIEKMKNIIGSSSENCKKSTEIETHQNDHSESHKNKKALSSKKDPLNNELKDDKNTCVSSTKNNFSENLSAARNNNFSFNQVFDNDESLSEQNINNKENELSFDNSYPTFIDTSLFFIDEEDSANSDDKSNNFFAEYLF